MMDLIQAAQVRAYPARHGVCGVREPLGLWMRWHHETQQSLSRALNRQGCTQERTVDVGAGRQRAAGRLRVSLVVFDTSPVLNLGWGGWPRQDAIPAPCTPSPLAQSCRKEAPLQGTTAGNGYGHG